MKLPVFGFAAALWLAFLCSAVAWAAPDDWAEGVMERDDGANQLPWRNRDGVWRDADGAQQGKRPFALASLILSGKRRVTADHAKALGKRFKLAPGYFL